jgi:hypothetical protein
LSSQTSSSNPNQAQSIKLTIQHGILLAFRAWCNQPLQYSLIATSPSAHFQRTITSISSSCPTVISWSTYGS